MDAIKIKLIFMIMMNTISKTVIIFVVADVINMSFIILNVETVHLLSHILIFNHVGMGSCVLYFGKVSIFMGYK